MPRLSLLLPLCCLLLPGLATDNGLTPGEQYFVGKWRAEKGRNQLGQGEYFEIEFRADRSGYYGTGLTVDGSDRYLPFLSFPVSRWYLSGDTLRVTGEVDASAARAGDDIRKELSGLPMSRVFVVVERTNNRFTGRYIDENLPMPAAGSATEKFGPDPLVFEKL